MASIVAVVLNWRDATSTIACVDALWKLQHVLNIVVVDNDSADGSLERIRQHIRTQAKAHNYAAIEKADVAFQGPSQRWVCTIPSGRNGGYAFGNNVGITCALSSGSCEYVWILNADTIVPDSSSLTHLLNKVDSDPSIGICGATVVYADNPACVQTLGGGIIDERGRARQYGQGEDARAYIDELEVESQLSYINGACSFVRRSFIEQIGTMSEDYFLYFEEADWAARAMGRFRLGYASKSVILHHVGKSIGTSDRSERSTLSTYYMTSSRLRFCSRHLRSALPHVVSDTLLEIARYIRRGKARHALAAASALLQTRPKLPTMLRII